MRWQRHRVSDEMARWLKIGALRLEYAAAEVRLRLAATALGHALIERRYRPDQPRVPAGSPDGGQWTTVGGGTPNTHIAAGFGRITFSGPLIGTEYDSDNNRTRCLYRDLATGHIFGVWEQGTYCPSGRINY